MKGMIQKLLILLLYLVILLYVTGFQWKNIFDTAGFCMVVLGMLLLSVPQLILKWRKKGKKEEILPILSWNALTASYITTVTMLLARFTAEVELKQPIREIALGCRPILYGLLFYVLFHQEKEKLQGNTEKQNSIEDKQTEKVSLTPEQLCYFFRAKGLTAREAEVARMLYQGCSNREIAAELYIAETTVKKHVTHILEKLKIEQRGQIQEIVAECWNIMDR